MHFLKSPVSLFTFKGRIRRLEYNLIIYGTLVICLAIAYVLVRVNEGTDSSVPTVLAMLLYIIFLFMWSSATIRQLHDLGHSAWFALLLLVPIVNFIFGVKIQFVSGDYGPNQYGPDAKRPELGDMEEMENEEIESEEDEKRRKSMETLARESDALEDE